MKIARRPAQRRLRTKIIRSIGQISASEWNKVFPPVMVGYGFFKSLDESSFDQFDFYYCLVYEGRELVGAAPCFSLDYSLDTSLSGPWRRLTNAITKIFPKIFSLKAFVCGVPMDNGHIGLKKNREAEILEALEQRMEAMARKLRAPFMAFKDFDQGYDRLFEGLLRNHYLKMDYLPSTRMKLDFTNFEGYLKKLSGASRYDFRRKLKKAGTIKIASSIVDALDEETLEEAYGLYLQMVKTHDMGFEIVPKEFFRAIARHMPQETKFFLWRINGRLAAFVFCLVSKDLLMDYYIGLDGPLAREYHLYFVKFKDVVEWCLSRGIKTYEMGTTGYEPKRRLKFEFVPSYLYVKARHRWLHPVLKLLHALLKFENTDPELRRWKKSLK